MSGKVKSKVFAVLFILIIAACVFATLTPIVYPS